MIRGIEKRVKNSFLIKHSYAYQLRNIEAKETMAYYQNKRTPWFERISQARQWSEEQEENSLQGEKIERPNTKSRFEKNLMVEVKIVEDPQAPLHVGAGHLPDWLRDKKKVLAPVDTYADELCIFRCIAVHQGAHPVLNPKKSRESSRSFFDKRRVRQIYKGHFPLIENHFQRRMRDMRLTPKEALR